MVPISMNRTRRYRNRMQDITPHRNMHTPPLLNVWLGYDWPYRRTEASPNLLYNSHTKPWESRTIMICACCYLLCTLLMRSTEINSIQSSRKCSHIGHFLQENGFFFPCISIYICSQLRRNHIDFFLLAGKNVSPGHSHNPWVPCESIRPKIGRVVRTDPPCIQTM